MPGGAPLNCQGHPLPSRVTGAAGRGWQGRGCLAPRGDFASTAARPQGSTVRGSPQPEGSAFLGWERPVRPGPRTAQLARAREQPSTTGWDCRAPGLLAWGDQPRELPRGVLHKVSGHLSTRPRAAGPIATIQSDAPVQPRPEPGCPLSPMAELLDTAWIEQRIHLLPQGSGPMVNSPPCQRLSVSLLG